MEGRAGSFHPQPAFLKRSLAACPAHAARLRRARSAHSAFPTAPIATARCGACLRPRLTDSTQIRAALWQRCDLPRPFRPAGWARAHRNRRRKEKPRERGAPGDERPRSHPFPPGLLPPAARRIVHRPAVEDHRAAATLERSCRTGHRDRSMPRRSLLRRKQARRGQRMLARAQHLGARVAHRGAHLVCEQSEFLQVRADLLAIGP
jgi:hypothetical protein